MGEEVNCQSEEITRLLPSYHAGRLGESERGKVAGHVSECPTCRESMKIMDLLTKADSEGSGPPELGHIPSGLLIRYYAKRAKLAQAEIDRVATHLNSCGTCRAELEFLTGLEDELNEIADEESDRVRNSEVQSTASTSLWRRPVFLLPLAAALVLLIGGAVSYRWYRLPSTGFEFANYEVQMLRPLRRTQGSASSIMRSSTDSTIVLGIAHNHRIAIRRYEFTLTAAESSETVVSTVQPDFERAGMIRLGTDTRGLPDGAYAIEMREIARQAPVDTVTAFFGFHLGSDE